MKILLKAILLSLGLIFLSYLILPSPEFPERLDGALVSDEPGDNETPLRRAYFTDLTRGEVLAHYQMQFARLSLLGIPVPTYRLNYLPEEAQALIRDQTRSTFLEEIVHPLRESLYINGFEPKLDKDAIRIGGKKWRQKVTVRYVPSSPVVRFTFGALSLLLVYFLAKDVIAALKDFKSQSL
ncbi:hypothetical protein A2115_02960 [Candidatus Woesebacteria bacterium GWA1_41_8]|uniref:Uncharacterized protein n=1 Tax=Candidatus Woesebacteria bacterium GWA1_41_8 TaxID=1802471 RepID=A0A1F7WJ14_9BACT|nr:MAG: hypothetical protein A2115_02960 [Candidatus Woesebacteria bacterium GWA1_41_8]